MNNFTNHYETIDTGLESYKEEPSMFYINKLEYDLGVTTDALVEAKLEIARLQAIIDTALNTLSVSASANRSLHFLLLL